MKAQLLLVTLGSLPSLTLSQNTAFTTYREWCPGDKTPSNPQKIYGDGNTIEWKCEVQDTRDTDFEKIDNRGDPVSCVKACADSQGCLYSVWLSGNSQCRLYKSQGTTGRGIGMLMLTLKKGEINPDPEVEKPCEAITSERNALIARLDECVGSGQPEKADRGNYEKWYKECKAEETRLTTAIEAYKANYTSCEAGSKFFIEQINQCQEEKKAYQDELKACNTNCETDSKSLIEQNKQCQAEKEECQDKLKTCSTEASDQSAAGNLDLFYADISLCPKADQEIRKVGGFEYKIHCGRGYPKGSARVPSTTASKEAEQLTECIAACSKERLCQGINFWFTTELRCLMYSTFDAPLSVRDGAFFISAFVTKQK